MNQQEAALIERLCQAQNPREFQNWEGQDGYYVAACRVSAEDVPRLIDIALRWSNEDWPENEESLNVNRADAELLPVTAWRTLADLKADAAVQPLVNLLIESEELDESDDWVFEELPHVFGKIGESAISPLAHLAGDVHASECVRTVAVRGLGCVAKYHAGARDHIVACLTELMAAAAEDKFEFNSALLVELVDLRAIEAAEPIERAFAGNLLDLGMMGDWEEVRRQLGVKGLGLKMPEHPHNSIEEFRINVGRGIFSEQPLFMPNEDDEEAAQAYYENARAAFSNSSEAQQVMKGQGHLEWFSLLLEFGVNYLSESVDAMTPESVREFVLEHVPRKISTEASSAAAIIGELVLFWEFLDRVYKLPAAQSILEWLRSEGLVSRLEAKLSDPANFGMAKSIFMQGQKAGHDMTSKAGLAAFIRDYNRSLFEEPAPAAEPPLARNQRVGRNDPCPCGSGKKFKKCCGPATRHGPNF